MLSSCSEFEPVTPGIFYIPFFFDVVGIPKVFNPTRLISQVAPTKPKTWGAYAMVGTFLSSYFSKCHVFARDPNIEIKYFIWMIRCFVNYGHHIDFLKHQLCKLQSKFHT